MSLLADSPKGITAQMLQPKRIVATAEEARTLLGAMEAEGELNGKGSKPEGGGHITRTFTKARQ